jgi:hypothetical protein
VTRVEERLTELLHSSAPPSQGVPFDEVKSRVRRRRAIQRSFAASVATAAFVVATVLVVTSTTGHPQRIAATPSVNLAGTIPWLDAPPPPYSPPVAPAPSTPAADARPCTARDVTAALADANGAGGQAVIYVRFRNISTSTCVLKGYPRVVASAPGHRSVIAADGSFFEQGSPANMRPGHDTYLGVETRSFCSAYPNGAPSGPLYHRLAITLPGGGTVVVNDSSYGFDVACGVSLTRFFVQQAAPAAVHDPLSDLTVALEVPSSVAAGSTLVYVADLSNPTGKPVSLDRCPAYVETGDEGSTLKESYALNCAPVGAIAAHDTVRFEMRLHVTPEVAPGPLMLQWTMSAPFPVSGTATVTVTRPSASTSRMATVTGVLQTVGGPPGAGPLGVSGSVTFVDATTGRHYQATAAADGTFTIAVPPGEYTVTGTSRQFDGGAGLCVADSDVYVTASGWSGVTVSCHRK